MSDLEQELQRHAGAMRRLARQLVGADAVEDLVQETTVQALQRPPHDPRGLGGWLGAVVRHHASKLRRSARRRWAHERLATPPTDSPDVADPAAITEQREAVQQLNAALMALPAPYQGVLLQRYFHDLTPTQIAAQNGAPIATIKSQLQRGLELLRGRIDRDAGRDWRQGLVIGFGLQPRAIATAVATTGVLGMSALLKSAAAAIAAAVLTWFVWPEAAPPAAPATTGAKHPVAAVASTMTTTPPTAIDDRQPVLAANERRPHMRLRIVDDFDRSPLPHFAVRIAEDAHQPDVGDVITTDELGVLLLADKYRDRDVTLVPLDDEVSPWYGEATRSVHPMPPTDAEQPPPEIAFACGPTYTLLFDRQPPDENLFAALTAGTNPRPAFGSNHGHVRRDPVPWLRLRPTPTSPTSLGRGPWTLVVTASQGDWFAYGEVASIRGRQVLLVSMHCVACGQVLVTATIDGHSPDMDGLRASLSQLDADGGAHDIDFSTALPGGNARARFERLEPGRYRASVLGPGKQVHQEEVAVRADETTVVHVDFHATTNTHALDVVARGETGQRNLFGLSFRADKVGGGTPAFAHYIGRGDGGAIVNRFDELADGLWDITLEPTPQLPPWQTQRQRVSASAGSIEFVCLDRDAPAAANITAVVVDAATGKAIVGAGVTSFLDGQQFLMTTTDSDGRTEQGPYLAGTPVQLLVRAAGHLPALVTTVPAADGHESLRIELNTGWGTMLVVVESDAASSHGRPLADVRVDLDDRFVGVTDQHGLLLLTNACAPRRIDLLREGYAVCYGSIDAKTGAPDSNEESPLFVVMKRQ